MINYSVSIHPKAFKKIQEIELWYNSKQDKLGLRFKDIIVKQIDSLSIRPKIYAIRYENFRCMKLKTFPYMVHFVVNEHTNTIEVYLVIGAKENPDKWGKV